MLTFWEFILEHRAYVSACIFSGAAFLESAINELYHSAIARDFSTYPGLSEEICDRFALIWECDERKPILEKYQRALLCMRQNKFPKGQQSYQDAESLIKLRNALVHFKPEWHDEQKIHNSLRKNLSRKFKLNPWAAEKSLWFPHRCLSAGCAAWSVSVIHGFFNEFSSRAKVI